MVFKCLILTICVDFLDFSVDRLIFHFMVAAQYDRAQLSLLNFTRLFIILFVDDKAEDNVSLRVTVNFATVFFTTCALSQRTGNR